VSIHLAPEYRGRGVGPAALERLAETAFGDLELGRLVARVKADNAASLAAFERAGFTRVVDGAAVTLALTRKERA
jgi:RimJ/RimL family protein N-acetyltransferase